MKAIIRKVGASLFAVTMLLSCNDDFLERYPLDELSNETFWKTENDLAVYNNNIYALTEKDQNSRVLMGHASFFASTQASYTYLDEFSDNLAPGASRHNRFKDVRAGIHIPAGTQNFGYRAWDLLRAINVGLDNMTDSPVEQRVKDKYIAEARMFRAWFYYDKVSKFGDVQWVDHEVKTNEDSILYGKRDPREFVMGKVLEDINFAVAKLPANWDDGRAPGRLDRWDALALKSRICLFEGTWRKYHGGSNATDWLQEAASASKDLIDNGPYSLYQTGDPSKDYNATHRVLKDLTGNPEVIHWVKYETGIRNNNIMKYYLYYSGGMTKDAIDDYLADDGLPVTLSERDVENTQIEDVFVNRDPRLRQTVLHPDDKDFYEYNQGTALPYPRVTGMTGAGDPSTTGYHIIKMYNRAAHLGQNQAETPAIVFRLGEIYLNYAEAVAELGTITQADLDMTINKLRDRVAMPHLALNPPMDPKYANDGISSLLVEIRRERRIELFSEGFRYEDLRRWKWGKKLEKKSYGMLWDDAAIARYPGAEVKTSILDDGKPYIEVYKGQPWETPVFEEPKHYLWPIPLSVLGQNPDLEQNPGWE